MLKTDQLSHSSPITRSPIYYGWIVWAVATIGLIATSPGQTFTVSWFFDRFIADFGLTRTEISTLYGLGTFIGALSLTWVGRQVDRVGNRRAGIIVGALFAATLTLLSLVTGPFTLLLGFVAIRGLGQGSLTLISTTVITQWFRRRRGLMLSLSLGMFYLFQRVYNPWLQRTLADSDWRQVWILLGIGVGVAVLPLTWLLMRDRPEQYGLQPDGLSEAAAQRERDAGQVEENWTLNEARRTSIFWIFLIGRFVPPTWGTGLVLHQISIFGTQGFSEEVTAATVGTMATVTAGSVLFSGTLIDRYAPGRILALQLGSLMTAMYVAMHLSAPWTLPLYAATFGLSMGNGGVFDGAVWVNLFGRQHQGAIRGFVTTTLVIGSAVGPIIFAVSYDQLGGYAPVLWVGMLLAAVPLVLSFFARKPRLHRELSVQAGD